MDGRLEHHQPTPSLPCPKPNTSPHGDVPYQYIILPTHFKEDRWVRMSEIRPGNRAVVHHAVAYIRAPGSPWLRGAPIGKAFSAEDLTDPAQKRRRHVDRQRHPARLRPRQFPRPMARGFAKLVPAGSDIVLQMHYAVHGQHTPSEDKTSIGLVFAKTPPAKRVLTLQLTNDHFQIRPAIPTSRSKSRAPSRMTRSFSASSPICTCAARVFNTTSSRLMEWSGRC